MPPIAKSLLDRATDKFLIGDDCWPWIASRGIGGYGQINSGGHNGKPLMAHRVIFEIVHAG